MERKRKKSKKKILIISLITIFVVLLLVLAYFLIFKRDIFTYKNKITIEVGEAIPSVKDYLYKDNKKVKEVKLINLYEIDVLNGDGRVEELEDGKFTIAIAIPESDQKYDNYKVVYFDEEGKLVETLNAKLENGKVVFTTSHLSTYGVIGYNNVTETPTETKPEKNPGTSDINLALIIGAIVISAAGVVITSKKISAKVTR